MKKNVLTARKDNYLNWRKKDRIRTIMRRYETDFMGVTFDKNGNVKAHTNVAVEPFNAELIFENEPLLKYIIIQLRKYLEERLPPDIAGYICFGNEDLEDRWIITEQFCEEMGIGFNFIQLLVDHLDYPACEGDFVNDFSLEDVLKNAREYKKKNGGDQNESSPIN